MNKAEYCKEMSDFFVAQILGEGTKTSTKDAHIAKEPSKTIEAILKRGNDVEIRRKGDGYIVLEVKKEIKYTTSA